MLRAQGPHQRVPRQVVCELGIARERPRIAPQRRNRRLDPLPEASHRALHCSQPCLACPVRAADANRTRLAGRLWQFTLRTNTCVAAIFPRLRAVLATPVLLAGACPLCHRRKGGALGTIMPEASGLLRGKRGLILGVANNRSIAWGIAKASRAQGAELAFTYQGDALKKRVEPLAQEVGGLVVGHCDVTEPATLDAAFAAVAANWGALDFLVHAIAFSDKDQLSGRYVDTTADNFSKTMQVSCYSFTAVAQRAEKLMPNGGSLLTLTYYGAEKWMPHYNVMGVAKAALEASVRYLAADLGEKNIRVNAISSGPIKTLAAS